MPDLFDAATIRRAVEQLSQAITAMAAEVGEVPVVRRLRHDVERIELDLTDCTSLQKMPPARALETIPDAPYDESLWQGVDDEGLGGFHAPHPQPKLPRTRHHR